MKHLFIIFVFFTNTIFGLDLFKMNEQVPPVDNNITEILKKEVAKIELKNTQYRIVDSKKYIDTGSSNMSLSAKIKITNTHDKLSSVTYKLEKNFWYFIKSKGEGVLRFFKYTSTDKSLFSKNNFYIKILENKVYVLFKTKNRFEPLTLQEDEILNFIIMDDDLVQKKYKLSRDMEEVKNEK